MKITEQRYVDPSDKKPGHFNGGQHLFVDIEAGQYQTVSCRLPNGKHVTFAFVPSSDKVGPNGERVPATDMECVDIHCNCGNPQPRSDKTGTYHQQNVVGFGIGTTSFRTKNLPSETSLITLLLSDAHNK